MKQLIIYAHPGAGSLNHYFLDSIRAGLAAKGHEVAIRDLYQLGFDPVLSAEDMAGQLQGVVSEGVQTEQEYIRWADSITFIYPIWWTGMPAMMKGYIDRVMSYGFAYRYDKGQQLGLLKGKTAVVINTHGKSKEEYDANGMTHALRLTADKGIYTYCGLDLKGHFFFDKADRPVPGTAEEWISGVLKVYDERRTVAPAGLIP